MTKTRLPNMPKIPRAVLSDHHMVMKLDRDRKLFRWYDGPIRPGMIFAWEPDLPHARELIIVVHVDMSGGDEARVWTRSLGSPRRGKPFMPHLVPHLLPGHEIPSDESRFREAVVSTTFKDQTP